MSAAHCKVLSMTTLQKLGSDTSVADVSDGELRSAKYQLCLAQPKNLWTAITFLMFFDSAFSLRQKAFIISYLKSE